MKEILKTEKGAMVTVSLLRERRSGKSQFKLIVILENGLYCSEVVIPVDNVGEESNAKKNLEELKGVEPGIGDAQIDAIWHLLMNTDPKVLGEFRFGETVNAAEFHQTFSDAIWEGRVGKFEENGESLWFMEDNKIFIRTRIFDEFLESIDGLKGVGRDKFLWTMCEQGHLVFRKSSRHDYNHSVTRDGKTNRYFCICLAEKSK